jgi:hypothetical protein
LHTEYFTECTMKFRLHLSMSLRDTNKRFWDFHVQVLNYERWLQQICMVDVLVYPLK